MEHNDKYTIHDLVVSALDQKPDEFAQGFDSLLVDRLRAAVDNRKQEIAQNMFADSNDFENDADQETDLTPEE